MMILRLNNILLLALALLFLGASASTGYPPSYSDSSKNSFDDDDDDSLVVVPLDRTSKGAGRYCPKTLPQYFPKMNNLFNTLQVVEESKRNFSQIYTTMRGTGRVFSGKIHPNAPFLTTYFQSDFTSLNQEQVFFIESLYENNLFSKELDNTYKAGTQQILADTTNAMGGIESRLYTTEFIFLPGLSILDRELMLISSRKVWNDTCVLYANPSVSDSWIHSVLKDPKNAYYQEEATYHNNNNGCNRIRALNLYPSGDRLCIRPTNANNNNNNNSNNHTTGRYYDVQVIHMITTDIGGWLSPLYSLGLFDEQTQLAYLSEAQKLEDKVHARN